MGKYLMAAALAVAGLAATNVAQAQVAVRAGPVGVRVSDRRPVHRPYYAVHGRHHHRGGYFYAGRSHAHWSHRVWDARFRRYHYFDPGLRAYFFFDPALNGFYPVPVAVAPVAVPVPVAYPVAPPPVAVSVGPAPVAPAQVAPVIPTYDYYPR